LLMIMSFFKLGSLITYIPRSVTIGFTAGVAVIIFSVHVENIISIEDIEMKDYFHQNMMEIVNNINTINLFSIIVELIGFAYVIIVPKIFPRVPVLLVALIIPTIASLLIFPGKVATIGTAFGGISQALPSFSLPEFTFDKLLYLWQLSVVIGMLGCSDSY